MPATTAATFDDLVASIQAEAYGRNYINCGVGRRIRPKDLSRAA